VFVAVLAANSFATNALIAEQAAQTSSGFGQPATRYDDSAYSYVFAVSGIATYAVLLGIVLLIAKGLPRRETFALYRPKSWPRTIGLVLGVLATTYVLIILVGSALGPGAETDQGIPVFWDGSRAAQFMLNLVVVAAVVPIVEELTFRGLGFSLLSRFGPLTALIGTAVLFGVVHGYLVALPIFVIFGLALGWLRMRTGSVYPGMVMHGLVNGGVTILAVILGA
jgi:CAAX protease family protein